VLYHLGASDRLLILKKSFNMVEIQQITTALTTKWQLIWLDELTGFDLFFRSLVKTMHFSARL